jgi:hypothetical protein
LKCVKPKIPWRFSCGDGARPPSRGELLLVIGPGARHSRCFRSSPNVCAARRCSTAGRRSCGQVGRRWDTRLQARAPCAHCWRTARGESRRLSAAGHRAGRCRRVAHAAERVREIACRLCARARAARCRDACARRLVIGCAAVHFCMAWRFYVARRQVGESDVGPPPEWVRAWPRADPGLAQAAQAWPRNDPGLAQGWPRPLPRDGPGLAQAFAQGRPRLLPRAGPETTRALPSACPVMHYRARAREARARSQSGLRKHKN